jgi:hypothetical protein
MMNPSNSSSGASGPLIAAASKGGAVVPSVVPVSMETGHNAQAGITTPANSTVPTPLGPMNRDPQLDAYLNAHRAALGARSLAVPVSTPAAPAVATR